MDQQQPPQQAPQMPVEQAPQMPPQQQPQWTPPPQQPTGWGGPSYGAPPPRPTGVTLAGIFLIVMGVLYALGGAACGLVGGFAATASGQDTSGILGFFAGLGIVFGIIALILGILQIAAGAGSMGGRGWARVTGIILSVIFAIFAILGGLGSFSSRDGMTTGLTTLVVGVLYALTAYALIRAGSWFAARR